MSRGVARAISIVLHPLVLMLVGVAAGAHRLPAARISGILLIVALVVAVPFTIFMVRQVRAGRWENVDASRPEERPRMFVVGLVLMAVLAAIAWRTPSMAFMARAMVAVCAMLLVAWALLRWIKLSLHVATAAMTAVILLYLTPALGVVLAALTPVLAWARITMKRHTLVEIALGTVVGIATGLAIVYL